MRVNHTDVIERMKRAGGLKNDSRLARALGVTPQALSNYKKRGKVPSDLILKFAGMNGLSVDWLLTGEGHRYLAEREGGKGAAGASHGEVARGFAKFAALTPDELIYIGKLLRIMRSSDSSTSEVLKWSIDAFLKAVESSGDEKTKGRCEEGIEQPSDNGGNEGC